MNSFEVLSQCSPERFVHQGFNIVVLRKPKILLEALPAEQLSIVVTTIHQVVIDGFGIEHKRMPMAEIREHILLVDLLAVVFDHDNNLCGFASARLRDAVFYLYGIALGAQTQASGVGHALVSAMLRSGNYRYLAFTTQSPAMYRLGQKCTAVLYPSPQTADVPEDIKQVAQQCFAGRRGAFNRKKLTVQNLFKHCMYLQIVSLADKELDTWFRKSLRVSAQNQTCDGFVCVGILPQ